MASIDIAAYLFTRLHQLGVRAVHGVPGDYQLTALDYIAPAGLTWIGDCSELTAGYAADGYARIKGISALVTTFGVGELSAINAIAGAYTEMAPLVHIVGTPSTELQDSKAMIHHSLCDGNGDYRVFAEMNNKITVARVNLRDAATAASDIDHALRECILQSRPVYIELPTNYVDVKIDSSPLRKAIDPRPKENDTETEEKVVEQILHRLYSSKQPFIMVDAGTSRYGVQKEVTELIRKTKIPAGTTRLGKAIIDETIPNFYGVYPGDMGNAEYKKWFMSCDLILFIGPKIANTNTFRFTTSSKPDVTITFDRDVVTIGNVGKDSEKHELHIRGIFQRLLNKLDVNSLHQDGGPVGMTNPRDELSKMPDLDKTTPIDHSWFWQRMSNFFIPYDIVLTETGTPSMGSSEFVFPANVRFINSAIWLSIGYMLGAAQGAAAAQRELIEAGQPHARTIVFEGDGSFQMSAHALSAVIKNKLDLIVFLINNKGYTIERYIHGWNESYNDVGAWRYLEAPSFFGAPKDGSYKVRTERVTNWGELQAVLQDEDFKLGKGLLMVEIIMDRDDAPEQMKAMLKG